MQSTVLGLLLAVCLFNIFHITESDEEHNRVKRQFYSSWYSNGMGYPYNPFNGNGGFYQPGYQPSSGGGYQPPTGGGYQPPSGGGYQPPTGGGQLGGQLGGQQGSGRICSCQFRNKRQADDHPPDDIGLRIVGGHVVNQRQYLQVVKVLLDGRGHCGGTILNERYVLTAGHCVHGRSDARRFSVVTGGSSQPLQVTRAVYNPNYNSKNYDNDVAVLQLSQPLPQFQATCVPTRARDYNGKTVHIVGWGKTSESGGPSTNLQEVDVPVVSNNECSSMMNNKYTITRNMLCAGYRQGGKDSCGGDSGGPAFINGDRGPLQVGVVSFGEGCARPNRPGVYARLDQQTQFLLGNMPDVQQCALYSVDA